MIYSNKEIKDLDLLINSKIDLFFRYFQCSLIETPIKFIGVCPIHFGDNSRAFNYYKAGYWACRSHQCHKNYYNTPLGLIRGLLGRNCDDPPSFTTTVHFVCKLLKTKIDDLPEIKPPPAKPIKTNTLNMTIENFRSKLEVPCPYYSKKFDADIVNQQHIGFCGGYGKTMNNRSVVPILNKTGDKVIACTGRSIHEECALCMSHHDPDISCPNIFYPKWKTMSGFNTGMVLYNYWEAKQNIGPNQVLFIVESIGNVLRQLEFGLKNTVATFGTQFSKFQQEMAMNSGATTFVYLPDNGEGGKVGSNNIKDALGENCHIIRLDIPDDIARLTKSDYQKIVLPRIREWL